MNSRTLNHLIALCFLSGAAQAQVPGIISHQGRFSVNGTNFIGSASFKFAIVTTNAPGSAISLWSHDGTSVGGAEPAGAALVLDVPLSGYSVNLGDLSVPNMVQEIPASIFTNPAVFLRIWANDGVIGFKSLSPDQRVASVGYALTAAYALAPVAVATNLLGTFAGDLTGTQGATIVSTVGGVSAASVGSGANLANAATNTNVGSTLVRRGAGGNFEAGTLTGALVGNAASLTNLTGGSIVGAVAVATHFTGPMVGDVTGVEGATVVSSVGGVTGVNVAAGSALARAATSATVAGTIVRRDAGGNLEAGTLTGTLAGNAASLTNLTGGAIVGVLAVATNFTGPMVGDLTGVHGGTVVSEVGGVTATNVSFGAGRALAATPVNELGTIVRRDPANRSFAAGTITARLVGDGSALTNLPTPPAFYGAPAGGMLVSSVSPDPILVAAGYREFMSTAIPTWMSGSTTNAPTARFGHTTVWSGQGMIVWGGTAGGTAYLGSGGIYDPTTDIWNATSSSGSPAARIGHSAVWAGAQMIVWGGKGTSGYLASGGRFNPGAQTWGAVASGGAPEARMGHVAVWTGSKMIVWGGISSTGLLNDCSLYDPALNQWSAINLANTPDGRVNATAVWAGDRMIVWGGMGDSGELNTGGQLIFSNGVPNHWRPSTIDNAPYPRMGHTATWTGDRMFVWGGQSGGIPLGDGAVYCASCDEWKGVSEANAPLPRYDHAAVWTGSEILIAGGANAGGAVSSSGGYDPLTQQWRTLSSAGNPASRSQLGAAWSGSELLLFGGYTGSQTMATLQRLSPQPAWYFYRKL